MGELPAEHIERFGLDRVACTLAKKEKFNATTFSSDIASVISLNYALEPILKHLNRYLLHYFCTREMAGPNRNVRAWEGIVPTVLHFWSDVEATRLMGPPAFLYGEEMAVMAHRLTSEQLSFIVAHELGHVALNHPHRLQRERTLSLDVTSVRHEFEYAADAFALGVMRSKLIKEIRSKVETPTADESENILIEKITTSLHDYQLGLGSIYLLFTYMDFIQRAGELLQDRLRGQVAVRTRIDTHPRARARLERLELMNVGEYLYTSPLQRYARDFLQTVLDYAAALDNKSLLASVTVSKI